MLVPVISIQVRAVEAGGDDPRPLGADVGLRPPGSAHGST